MFDGEGGKRVPRDVLVVPFIFVPHGDPVPTEWLATRTDPIRLPATFMPRRPTLAQPAAQFSSEVDLAEAAADFGHGQVALWGEVTTEQPRSLRAEPASSAPDPDEAIATYMRTNRYLDRVGLGHSKRPRQIPALKAGGIMPGAKPITQLASTTSPNSKIALRQAVIGTEEKQTLPNAGQASTYSDYFVGRPTSSGRPYSHANYTAALLPQSRWRAVPLGTKLRLQYKNRSVIVEVNDRGAGDGRPHRVLDLSRAAMAYLQGFGVADLNDTRL